MDSRTSRAIALRPSGNEQEGHYFPKPTQRKEESKEQLDNIAHAKRRGR